MIVFSRDLEELLWFYYDPLLIGLVWLAGVLIFVFSAIQIRKHHRTAIACLLVLAFGSTASIKRDYLAVALRFWLSQAHYEDRVQQVLSTGAGAKAKDVAGIEGNRVAFYWYRGVTDNWVGLVFDPSDSLAEQKWSRGQKEYFGGDLISARHLDGHWYLCVFT